MKASIIDVNYSRELYIFEREDGEYGYFELLGSPDLEVDDILIGNFQNLGGETVIRLGSNEYIDIYIEDFCSYALARDMIS